MHLCFVLRRAFLVFALLFGGAAAASAMSYRVVDAALPGCKGTCPKVIVATGNFDLEEHLQFLVFLDEASGRDSLSNVIIIDSPGGFVHGAMMMGLAMRHLKMTAIVGRWTGETITPASGLAPGTCASACVFALAGATARHFTTGSRIGVHQQNAGREVLDPTTRQSVTGTLDYEADYKDFRRFFSSLGLDGGGIVSIMAKTPTEDMHWFSDGELSKFRIARSTSSTAKQKKRQ